MPNISIIKAVLNEYGVKWVLNRALYNAKLKSMKVIPITERLYEKKPPYPSRLDLFQIDVDALQHYIKNELSVEDQTKLIQIADKTCEGKIVGFSSVELNYGNPVDWQLSPLTGIRCDESLKWYKIPDFDDKRGDIKVVWEASRFSHFITLSRAFLLTGEKKYYQAFSTQLFDWLKKNKYGLGANFKCGQECSLRMINTLLAYTVFKNKGVTTDVDSSCVKDLVDRCYRKILGNFFYAYKCIKNNHTISELMGMIVGAWCCEDQRQVERGYKLLDRVIGEQFTDDGGYIQFSFNYQRLALQDLEVILSITKKTNRSLSSPSKEKIEKSALLMYQCQDASGDVPNYGSNDGALIFPVTSCGYRDFRPVVNTICALCLGKQVYEADKHQEELIWFGAERKLTEYKINCERRMASQFADAGLFTMRTCGSWAMIVSNQFASRPGHMDQLHFDLWTNEENVLCDAGTFSYASGDGRYFAKNISHNTVVVDSKTQMNTFGSFMVYGRPKRELVQYNDNFFSGKMISSNGYTHTREIKQIGETYEITDKANNDCRVLFHTPCDVRLENGSALLSKNGKALCMIQSTGEIEVQHTERSLYYLKKDKTNCLSISGLAGVAIITKILILSK